MTSEEVIVSRVVIGASFKMGKEFFEKRESRRDRGGEGVTHE
jgi:hypothetical protein